MYWVGLSMMMKVAKWRKRYLMGSYRLKSRGYFCNQIQKCKLMSIFYGYKLKIWIVMGQLKSFGFLIQIPNKIYAVAMKLIKMQFLPGMMASLKFAKTLL